jgi:hypothetical protein
MLIVPAFFAVAQSRKVLSVTIPSPIDVVMNLKNRFVAHCLEARRDQEMFQAYLQELGIERASRMTPAETINNYIASTYPNRI